MLASTLLAVLPLLGAAYAAPPSQLVRHRRTMSSDMSSGTEASSGGMMGESSSMDSGCGSSGCGAASSMAMAGTTMDSSGGSGGCGSSGCGGDSSMTTTMMADSGCGSSGCGGATTIVMATTTVQTQAAATYGSGSSSWGSGGSSGGDLNSCLQMCQAQFGGGMSSGSTGSSGSSYGSGSMSGSGTSSGMSATKTVHIITAPSKGVLRYVPFAVDTNPGDTIMWHWGAGPHSVTASSFTGVCNKTGAYDSGLLNATATFTQPAPMDNTLPSTFYCTVPTHCQKGMFGMFNPPSTNVTSIAGSGSGSSGETPTATTPSSSCASSGCDTGSSSTCNSMDCWISSWSSSGSAPAATVSVVKQACQGTNAWSWGGSWDMSGTITETITKEVIIENHLYSRLFFAMNPTMLPGASDGSNFTMDSVKEVPDLQSFVAANGGNASSSSTASGSAASGSSTAASAAAASGTSSTGSADRSVVGGGSAILIGLAGLAMSALM